MATKIKTFDVSFVDEGGALGSFFRRFTGDSGQYDFEGIATLRKLLSNKKVKLLHAIKTKKPVSIYGLAKLLERDFKSVSDDINLLERFGIIDMIAEKSGKRRRLKPVLIADSLQINVKIN